MAPRSSMELGLQTDPRIRMTTRLRATQGLKVPRSVRQTSHLRQVRDDLVSGPKRSRCLRWSQSLESRLIRGPRRQWGRDWRLGPRGSLGPNRGMGRNHMAKAQEQQEQQEQQKQGYNRASRGRSFAEGH